MVPVRTSVREIAQGLKKKKPAKGLFLVCDRCLILGVLGEAWFPVLRLVDPDAARTREQEQCSVCYKVLFFCNAS